MLVTAGGEARSLELALEFREKSPDYEETAARIAATLHSGDVSAGQSFPFSLALPPDALPALTSSHGELWWEVDVKCDEALGRDEHVRRRIDLVAR